MITEIREPNFSVDLPGEWEQAESEDPTTLVFRETGGGASLSVTLLGVKPMFAIADRLRLLEDYMHHRSRFEEGQRPALERSEPTTETNGEAFVGEWAAVEPESGQRLLHHVVLVGLLLADFTYEAQEADEGIFWLQAKAVFASVPASE